MKGLINMVLTFALCISVIYIVSPIDALPDFLPILGWADDMGAVLLASISGVTLTLNKK